MDKKKYKSILIKTLKITGWVVLSIFLILIVAILSLRIPRVQEFVTGKALEFFKNKVDTEASIGRLYVDFPKTIVIEDIYLADQKSDTLLYAHHIGVNTDLWGLLHNRLQLNDLDVDHLVANVSNTEQDSIFNYQFIIDAFAPADTTQVPVDSSQNQSFAFSIKEVNVAKARILYADLYQGMRLDVNIGDLYTYISKFDLEKSQIFVDEISLKNTRGNFTILKEMISTDTTTSEIMDVQGRSLLVDNVKFNFEDQPGNLKLQTDIGHVAMEVDSMSLERQVYVANSIAIANSFISIDQYSQQSDTTISETDSTTSADINLLTGVKEADIENTSFRFVNHNYEPVEGFDPNHLWFQKLNASLKNTIFENGFSHGEVTAMSVIEKGGMQLKEFSTVFKYDSTESFAKDLHLVTNYSNINGDLAIQYPSLEIIQENLNHLLVDAEIDRSRIDFDDIFYFQPALKENMPFLTGKSSQVIIEGDLKGSMNDLKLNKLKAEAFNATSVNVTGSIAGLPDIENTKVNLKINQLSTTSADIKTVLSDTLIPENISVPPQLSLTGSVQGSINDVNADLKLKSSYGALATRVELLMDKDSVYNYNGNIEIDEFNLGKLLKQEAQMGMLSLKMEAQGKGFSLEDLNTKLKGEISSMDYNDYTYKDVKINGNVKSREFNGHLAMADSSLDFDFNGLVNLNDTIPEYHFTLDLKKVDLYALNFSGEELKVRAYVDTDVSASSLQNINGTVEITDLVMGKGTDVYRMDTFLLSSTTLEDSTDIAIHSNVLDANFKGNFDLVTLPQVLQQHFNRYYSLADIEDVDKLEPQNFNFNINIKRPRFFTDLLIPELTELRPEVIEGNYNSELWQLNINISVPKIVYGGAQIDSLGIKIQSDEYELTYLTKVARMGSGSFYVDHVNFKGTVESDHIKTDLTINDDKGETKYMFGGIFISGPDYYRFQFTPGEFMLNYEDWQVKPSNSIDLYASGMWVQNMILNQGNQQIHVESTVSDEKDSLLTTNINNFDLGFLGKLEETETYLVGGILNGDFDINMDKSKFAFTSNLDVKMLSFKGDTLGNLTVVASNQDGNKYNLDLDLNNNKNNVKVDGYYLADSIPELHLDANLVSLDLSTIESFTMGQLSKMQGSLTGDLRIRGTLSDPDILGKLNFNQATFNVTYLQSLLTINNETLSFTKTGIAFNDFDIEDVNGNSARLNGQVTTTDYSFYEFDLKAKTNNFLMLNTTSKDNELYYGHLEVNSTASISGDSNQPNVEIDVSLNEGSELTYVIPEAQITEQQTKGIVEWYDKDVENDPFYQQFTDKQNDIDTVEAQITGINIQADIDINKGNTLNVVIDPVTGDNLTVKGDATLKLGINPSGDINLAGRYEVDDGAYNLNFYGLVKREFRIEKGSYLLWTGDVLNARMDISAVYAVKTSPPTEIAGTAAANQRIPFLVYTDIEGELLQPEISFRLGIEEGAPASANVSSWVAQLNNRQEELDQQVFGLLLFKNFILGSQNSAGGNVAQTTARNSISKILNSQLSKLSSKVKGVDLSLNLESTPGTTDIEGNTQLELGLSKQFFNNRVVVKVAGNFNLNEGSQNQQQQTASDFAGDIRIEYKLTEDGRYRLVGFRENEYDNLFQGGDDIVKTGVGIIFVRDYDSFRELFKIKDKEKEEKKEKEKKENNEEDNTDKEENK